MKRQFKTILVVALLIIGSNSNNSMAATSITLQERIAMRSSVVRLGDVAKIDTADRAKARQLAMIPLLPAPAPGTERYLLKREVADLLEANGLNLQEIDFQGADRVAICAPAASAGVDDGRRSRSDNSAPMNRHAQLLAGVGAGNIAAKFDDAQAQELQDKYCRIVADYLDVKAGQPGGCRVSCDVDERFLALLDAKTSQPVCRGGSEPWIGRQRFVVSFTTTQGKIDVPINAEVAAKAVPVVVTIRPIARGDVITASQIEVRPVENVPRPTDRRAACDSIEKIVGMQARQAIPLGQVVFSDQVEEQTLVKRNEVVTVTSQSGGIRVRTTAKARQDGARGELIQVESLDTHDRYDVRVVGLRDTAVCVISNAAAAQPAKQTETTRRPSTAL